MQRVRDKDLRKFLYIYVCARVYLQDVEADEFRFVNQLLSGMIMPIEYYHRAAIKLR